MFVNKLIMCMWPAKWLTAINIALSSVNCYSKRLNFHFTLGTMFCCVQINGAQFFAQAYGLWSYELKSVENKSTVSSMTVDASFLKQIKLKKIYARKCLETSAGIVFYLQSRPIFWTARVWVKNQVPQPQESRLKGRSVKTPHRNSCF